MSAVTGTRSAARRCGGRSRASAAYVAPPSRDNHTSWKRSAPCTRFLPRDPQPPADRDRRPGPRRANADPRRTAADRAQRDRYAALVTRRILRDQARRVDVDTEVVVAGGDVRDVDPLAGEGARVEVRPSHLH